MYESRLPMATGIYAKEQHLTNLLERFTGKNKR